MELTERDSELIAFLQKGFIADTNLLNELFFDSFKSCSRRLVKLTRQGLVKRTRKHSQEPYTYYCGQMPSNRVQALLKAKIFKSFKKSSLKILAYKNNFKVRDVVIDLLIMVETPKKEIYAVWIDVKTKGAFVAEKLEKVFQDREKFECVSKEINKVVPCKNLKIVACAPTDPQSKAFNYAYIRPTHLAEDLVSTIQTLEKW